MKNLIKKRVFRIINDTTVAFKCAFCTGTGAFPDTALQDSNNDKCPVCKGKGIVLMYDNVDNFTICNFCKGQGQISDEDGYFLGDTCDVCLGKGIILIKVEKKIYKDIWKYLHPQIVKIAKKKFNDGYYADAVETCFKEYNSILKHVFKITGKEYDGADLMRKSFSRDNPIIALTPLVNESDRNVQQGYMEISAGAMTGIRNPKAHKNLAITPERAIHQLFLCSLLFYIIDPIFAAT